jgi:hypothetical protein
VVLEGAGVGILSTLLCESISACLGLVTFFVLFSFLSLTN